MYYEDSEHFENTRGKERENYEEKTIDTVSCINNDGSAYYRVRQF